MSLLIVAAKDTNEALELLSTKPKKAIKTHFVEKFEGIDNFLYDFKDEFLHYEIYYRFDPYRETYLEASSVCKIKIFSGSILQWITENCAKENTVADGLFCREIDGLFCRSSPDIIVRRRCVLSHKRRGWLQPSPSFRYSRNLALQDELYHPVINNGPAVLVCVDKRLGTGPVNQSRDAG